MRNEQFRITIDGNDGAKLLEDREFKTADIEIIKNVTALFIKQI